MRIPSIEIQVFWDGDGWYIAHAGDSDRLAGPLSLHDACKSAIDQGFIIADVSRSRGSRHYRNPKLPQSDLTEAAVRYEVYIGKEPGDDGKKLWEQMRLRPKDE